MKHAGRFVAAGNVRRGESDGKDEKAGQGGMQAHGGAGCPEGIPIFG